MFGDSVFLVWADFLIHNIIYWYLNDYIKNGKEKFEKGRSFALSQVVKIMYIVVFFVWIIGTGRLATSVMPVLINHDYRTFSGDVLEIQSKGGKRNEGLYNYEVILDVDGEKKQVGYLYSPEININDRIVYYVSTESVTKPVIQINDRDVTERYLKRSDNKISVLFWERIGNILDLNYGFLEALCLQ